MGKQYTKEELLAKAEARHAETVKELHECEGILAEFRSRNQAEFALPLYDAAVEECAEEAEAWLALVEKRKRELGQ